MKTKTVRKFCVELDENDRLEYETLVDEIMSEDGQALGEILGVSVKSTKSGEMESVRYITTDQKKMDIIFDMLVKGEVTPITLKDVIYDILD